MLKEEFEESGEKMASLYTYISQTWFNNSIWKPREICAYKRLIRTNNDTEGYHRRLNSRLGEKPPIYKMISFLYKEAVLVDVTCKLITCKNIKMIRRKKTREAQAHVTDLWTQFEERSIDAKTLLLEATKLTAF